MNINKRITTSSLVSLVLTTIFAAPAVFADSLGVVIQRGSGYGIVGGDSYLVQNPPPSWIGLSGRKIVITNDLVDGKPVIQGDVEGEKLNNGYIAIYPSDVSSWVTNLKGNQQWVQRNVTGAEQFSIRDQNTYNTTQLVPFMDVANKSGAIVGSDQYVPNGGYYNGQPTYTYEMALKPSVPPSVNSFSASV